MLTFEVGELIGPLSTADIGSRLKGLPQLTVLLSNPRKSRRTSAAITLRASTERPSP